MKLFGSPAPTGPSLPADREDPGGHFAGEHVAVAVVLMLAAPRVLPVIEDLAAQQVTADAPGMLPSAVLHHLLSHPDGVGIDHLEGAVAVSANDALRHRDGVVVGRRVAEVKPEERRPRRSVGQDADVAGDEPEMLRVPGARRLVVDDLEENVPQLGYLGRGDGRRCVSLTRTMRSGR